MEERNVKVRLFEDFRYRVYVDGVKVWRCPYTPCWDYKCFLETFAEDSLAQMEKETGIKLTDEERTQLRGAIQAKYEQAKDEYPMQIKNYQFADGDTMEVEGAYDWHLDFDHTTSGGYVYNAVKPDDIWYGITMLKNRAKYAGQGWDDDGYFKCRMRLYMAADFYRKSVWEICEDEPDHYIDPEDEEYEEYERKFEEFEPKPIREVSLVGKSVNGEIVVLTEEQAKAEWKYGSKEHLAGLKKIWNLKLEMRRKRIDENIHSLKRDLEAVNTLDAAAFLEWRKTYMPADTRTREELREWGYDKLIGLWAESKAYEDEIRKIRKEIQSL